MTYLDNSFVCLLNRSFMSKYLNCILKSLSHTFSQPRMAQNFNFFQHFLTHLFLPPKIFLSDFAAQI